MPIRRDSALPAHPTEPSLELVAVASCVTIILVAVGFLLP